MSLEPANPNEQSDSKINESASDHNAASEMKKVNNIHKAKAALMAPLSRKKAGQTNSTTHDYSQAVKAPEIGEDNQGINFKSIVLEDKLSNQIKIK